MKLRLPLTLIVVALLVTLSALVRFLWIPEMERQMTQVEASGGQRQTNLARGLRSALVAYREASAAGRARRMGLAEDVARDSAMIGALSAYLDGEAAKPAAPDPGKRGGKGNPAPAAGGEEAERVRQNRWSDLRVNFQRKLEQADFAKAAGDAQFVLVDAAGKELVRAGSTLKIERDWTGLPTVKAVLEAGARTVGEEGIYLGAAEDPEDERNKVVNAVPVRLGDRLLGALLMRTPIRGAAAAERRLTVADLGFFTRDGLLDSTGGNRHGALAEYLASNKAQLEAVLGKPSDKVQLLSASIGGRKHLIALANHAFERDSGVGIMMFVDADAELEFLQPISFQLGAVTAVLALIGVVLVLLLVGRAYRLLDFVLEGANEIILGNKDYEFHSDDKLLDDVGQTLNLANAILTGKWMPESEEEAMGQDAASAKHSKAAKVEKIKAQRAAGGGRTGESRPSQPIVPDVAAAPAAESPLFPTTRANRVTEPTRPGPSDSPDSPPAAFAPSPRAEATPAPQPEAAPAPRPAPTPAAPVPAAPAALEPVPAPAPAALPTPIPAPEPVPAPSAEDEEKAYYDRLFAEYAEAKHKLAQETGTTREKLEQTLRKNEQQLKEKYKCKAVRFVVNLSGDKVTLKPIPVRD